MNKNILISLVVLVLVVVGLYGFSIKNSDNVLAPGRSTKDGIAGVFKKGANQKCVWKSDDGKNMGTIYVSGDKFRSEITGQDSDNPELTMYALTDGKWMYSWSSDKKTGTKMKVEDVKKEQANTEGSVPDESKQKESTNVIDDLASDPNYKCESWKVDESMFVAPTDVEFEDMGALLEESKKSMKDDMKGYCYSMDTKAEQDDCLKAMETVELPGN